MSTLSIDDIKQMMELCKPVVEKPVMILIGRKEAEQARDSEAAVSTDPITGAPLLNGIPCKVVDVDSLCKPIYKRDIPGYLGSPQLPLNTKE